MNKVQLVKVIETKRRPPIWSVKVGARYVDSFMGEGARERALKRAKEFGKPELVKRPALNRPLRKPS
jgi:hypothetical protein